MRAETAGVDLDAVGSILMIVGVLGLLLGGLSWSGFSPDRRGRRVVVEEGYDDDV